jgi:hypothetical protein
MAAFMAGHGLPALRFLTTTDDTERLILQTVAELMAEDQEREERRARRA